jgi:UDP-N-acetylglucosamine 4-epimerase
VATPYERVSSDLRKKPHAWLITGVAGFIGSNLLEALLSLNQKVIGLDNFATGHAHNLEDVRASVGEAAWERFDLIKGDVTNIEDCAAASSGIDYVLHQAALGSVPRSIADPIATTRANVDGFVNMLVAAKDSGVKRFVYASSSAVYGDHPKLPKVEAQIGNPLSPYAVTKRANELYGEVFARTYDVEVIGLRYFNVFGRRQDANGAYAAVIPRWFGHLLRGEVCLINGDGETSRDFCYIDNVVQANLLAAVVTWDGAIDQVYNIALGAKTTLNELYALIRNSLLNASPDLSDLADFAPVYGVPRPGDVRHSRADISKATRLLGYEPTHTVEQGISEALDWYITRLGKPNTK